MWLNQWLRFWLAPADPRIYKILRIAYGIVSFLNLIQLFPDRYSLLSDQGVIGIEASEQLYRHTYSLFWYWNSPTAVDIVMLLAALSCVALIFNFLSRAALIFLFLWGISYLPRIGFGPLTGGDLLLLAVGFNLMIGPLGRRNSSTPIYALRLIQFQVSIMYLHTFLGKIQEPTWQDGTAVAYFFMSGISLFRNPFWAFYPFLSAILTYATLVFEATVPTLLWNQKTRLYGFLSGYVFHGVILVTTTVPVFSLVVMMSYLAFLTGDDLNHIQRIARRYLPLRS